MLRTATVLRLLVLRDERGGWPLREGDWPTTMNRQPVWHSIAWRGPEVFSDRDFLERFHAEWGGHAVG